MSLEKGTRGHRQPGGRLLRWANALIARWLRRRGPLLGFDLLLLTTIGRRSGIARTNPVSCFREPDGSWLIVASADGAAGNPAWYHNLAARPDDVRVETNGRTVRVTARPLHGSERAAAWRRILADAPRFARYQRRTDREFPVIRLTPRS